MIDWLANGVSNHGDLSRLGQTQDFLLVVPDLDFDHLGVSLIYRLPLGLHYDWHLARRLRWGCRSLLSALNP